MESVTGCGKRSATVKVLEAVASRDGRDVAVLPPLYDTIDPEALDRIVESGAVSVEFTYCGYEVVVEGESVTVTRR